MNNMYSKLWNIFIRKYSVPDFIVFDGEAPMYYGKDKICCKVWTDIHKKWVKFINN